MSPGILPEHGFKHKGNDYATLPWFGKKIAQKHAERVKTKTWSTQVFVATWNAMFSRSQQACPQGSFLSCAGNRDPWPGKTAFRFWEALSGFKRYLSIVLLLSSAETVLSPSRLVYWTRFSHPGLQTNNVGLLLSRCIAFCSATEPPSSKIWS